MDYKIVLRHHLATLAFRTEHAIKDSKENYPDFSSGQGVRTPKEILEHMIQLIKGSDDIIQNIRFEPVQFSDWNEIKKEFYNYLQKLDKTIENYDDSNYDNLLSVYQGPMSDAMTHVGQLTTIRRLSGDPVKGINFYREKNIEIGNFDY